MTDLASFFDQYSRKARLYPAFLTVAPVLLTVALVWSDSPLGGLWPLAVGTGLLFAIAAWVRGRGQIVERRLVQEWRGMPTTHMLRYRDVNGRAILDRRRQKLTALTGIELPTDTAEQTDPAEADTIYVAATRALIAKVRAQQKNFPRVHDENMHYGFWRNLYAMKPLAISVVILNLAFDVFWSLTNDLHLIAAVLIVLHTLFLLAWTVVVNPDRVRQQGQTYAERLFETLEDDRLFVKLG